METLLKGCQEAIRALRRSRPLIHCLTGHVTINDSANAVLACGGRPIMSEHPRETQEVTAIARALVLNLNNISDHRMESMKKSGPLARRMGLPITLDPVGVTCSSLRRELAEWILEQARPSILRGNLSEIRLLAHLECDNAGIDAGERDQMAEDELGRMVAALARERQLVAVATGPVDVASDGAHTVAIHNGTPLLGSVTGTGCMCAAMTGAFSAVADPLAAAVTATAVMGIAGELAQEEMERRGGGIGTFKACLFDAMWQMDGELFAQRAKLTPL